MVRTLYSLAKIELSSTPRDKKPFAIDIDVTSIENKKDYLLEWTVLPQTFILAL